MSEPTVIDRFTIHSIGKFEVGIIQLILLLVNLIINRYPPGTARNSKWHPRPFFHPSPSSPHLAPKHGTVSVLPSDGRSLYRPSPTFVARTDRTVEITRDDIRKMDRNAKKFN